MTRELFWQAAAEYREAALDPWSVFMRFIDGRNDYSLAIFEGELDVDRTLMDAFEEKRASHWEDG